MATADAQQPRTVLPWKRAELLRLFVLAGVAGLAAYALAPQAQDTPLNRVRRQPLRPPNATGTSGVGVNENTFTGNKSGIMWGPWIQYYQEVWDGPGIYAARVQADPSVFHYNVEIADTLLPSPMPFLDAVKATNTDAAFYLTVYPFKGWDIVTPAALAELVAFCRAVIQSGRKMIVRFAPEMNGTWFTYGQHPSYFKMMWMAVWNAIKSDPVARATDMMWAVNSIQGYPFCGGSEICAQGKPWENETDTNAPVGLDGDDDPYMPYYPGDDFVDSVGMSIYHYGIQYPWLENVVPDATKFVDMVRGRNGQGTRDFYKTFCEERGKMFAVAESAVATHVMLDQGVGQVAIKTAWWKQIWDAKKEFPNLYLVTFFEHIKHEEQTFRDFMSASIYHPDVNAAFQRSIHTNPDLIFAKRNGPEQPYIVYGRWTNMSYPPLQTGSYPAYDPKWNGTAINGTTKASVATVKSTVLATSTANTASAKVTAAATSIVQPVARTTTADTATATVRTSGAEQMRAGIAAMIAVLLAVLML